MKRQITLTALRTSVVLALRLLVQSGILLIVARLLGPVDYGAYASITSLALMLGTLSTFGTHIVLLAEVSRNPLNRVAILPFAVTTTLLCGSFLLGIYLLITAFIPSAYNLSLGVRLAIGVAELLLLPLITIPSAEHQGHGRIATSQVLLTFPLFLRLLVAIVVWRIGYASPLPTYAYGYAGTSAIALLIATLSLRGAWPHTSSWRLPTVTELKHSAGYALLNITAAGPTELDKTLSPRVLAPASAGIYSASARVVGALTVPVVAMMLTVMPKLFRDGDIQTKQTWRLLIGLLAISLCYGILLDFVLWIAAPLFGWLFGPNYIGIDHAIRWLCIAVPGMSLRITIGTTLMSLRYPWLRATFEIAGLAILFLATLTLAPRYHIIGMSIALACSEWSMAIIGGLILTLARHGKSSAVQL